MNASYSPERLPVIICPGAEIARQVAGRIAELIQRRASEGKPAVLGLATGSTPIGVYQELVRLHREEGLDFSNVVTFNLDEYYRMSPDSLHAYHRFMRENLFDHINIRAENTHIPRGDIPPEEVEAHCAAYERSIAGAGGIDLQILGIGRSGHIGFNEPGSGRATRTRRIDLDMTTMRDAAAEFFGTDNVPRHALTMGVGTILEARQIILIATGEHKAPIIRRAVEEEVSQMVTASYLQAHPDATVYLDEAAASELTRCKTPWLLKEPAWDRALEKQAVVWLAGRCERAIRNLDETDYIENHLASLLERHPSVDALNDLVFNDLRGRILETPDLFSGQRVVVFSPHPDDDVISMGGTLRKLVQQGNEVWVAYMVSGNIAVFDHDVRRHLQFARFLTRALGLNSRDVDGLSKKVAEAFARKRQGDVDIREVQEVKRVIRESEACSACECVGVPQDRVRFLNLPFYRTGMVRKLPIRPEDVGIVRAFLEEVRPQVVFAAGDLSDPHGTHRMCKDAIDRALGEYHGPPPDLYLYRGAWQEWGVETADVFVPLSRVELREKVMAIYRHESQKDRALFPGADEREFWQRAEQRNVKTAQTLDRLGLPEYYSAEAFVVIKGKENAK